MAFDPITAGVNLAQTLVQRLVPDKAQQAEASTEILKMVTTGEIQQVLGQIDINKTEAGSNSIFVAGWRPFVGWICGAGLGYEFLLRPILTFTVGFWRPTYGAPGLDMGTLLELLLALLGMGAMRTIDKMKGTDNGH